MPAADYLRASYYEKWLYALVENAVRHGLITREEAETGQARSVGAQGHAAADRGSGGGDDEARPPLRRATVERQPVFQLGDAVRTRNINPADAYPPAALRPGQTRRHRACCTGRTSSRTPTPCSQGENPQPLYTVEFRARDLWGEAANPRDTVRIDLWEDYLEPAR